MNISKVTHLLAYGLYRGLTGVARLFPLDFVFRVGQGIGLIGFHLLRSRRGVATRNLMLALNKSAGEARILCREHFMNLGANMLSALKISTMTDAQIGKRVTIDVPPELGTAREAGDKRGWVAMISHMGNWELFSHLSPFLPDYKYGAVYHKLANDYVDRHFKESRALSGVTLFDRREGYLKCIAFIREGGAVGVLVDQYAGLPGTWMPFFRRLTSTSTLAATLAQRSGVEIIPIAIKTTGIARWHVTASMPIPPSEDAELYTANINRELERQIEASPADWLWSHNRWKTPRQVFLFTRSGRRIYYPPGFDQSTQIPYRMLIRAADGLEEAQISAAAVRAVKKGRPDAHVTVIADEASIEFWKGVTGIDAVIGVAPGESPKAVGEKIKQAGIFDVGILFSPEKSAALECKLGRVPYRIGPPRRFMLNDWNNADGLADPPLKGQERYHRIVQGIGGVKG